MINIIAVDDEKDLKLLYDHFFADEIEDGKFSFFFESSAQACLDRLKSFDSDVLQSAIVMTDINMPEIDGISLTQIINSKFPSVKVMLVSAYEKVHYEDRLENAVAIDFLTKPIDFNQLKTRILNSFEVTA